MKRIDLLPERLKTEREQRRMRRVHASIVIVVAAVLIAWAMGTFIQVKNLDRLAAQHDQDLQPMRDQVARFEKLESTHNQLAADLRRVQVLRESVPTVAILALLSQIAPDDAVLQSLEIDLPLPPQESLSGNSESATQTSSRRRGSRGPSSKSEQSSPAAEQAVVRIQLEGVARHDAAVARFVSLLSGSESRGVFQNVRLTESREMPFLNHNGHYFRISMTVPATPIAVGGALAQHGGNAAP